MTVFLLALTARSKEAGEKSLRGLSSYISHENTSLAIVGRVHEGGEIIFDIPCQITVRQRQTATDFTQNNETNTRKAKGVEQYQREVREEISCSF